MWIRSFKIVVVTALILGGSAAAAVLQPASTAITSEQRPLSPTVWATIAVNNEGAELIVLWRGSPGWYMKAGPRSERASGNSQSYNVSLEYGSTRLALSFDRRRREATLGSRTVTLPAETNTILVDHVDDSGLSMAAFSKLQLSSMMTNAQLGAAISGSPMAVAFLQCDQQPNGTQSFAEMAHIVCDQIDTHH